MCEACSRSSGGGYRRSRPDRLLVPKGVYRKSGIWKKTVVVGEGCGATRRAARGLG